MKRWKGRYLTIELPDDPTPEDVRAAIPCPIVAVVVTGEVIVITDPTGYIEFRPDE